MESENTSDDGVKSMLEIMREKQAKRAKAEAKTQEEKRANEMPGENSSEK